MISKRLYMVHQWAPAAYRPTAGHINEQAAKSVPRPISRCCEIRNGPLSASKGTIVVTGAVTHRGKTGRCSRAKRTTGDQNGRFPGAAPIRRHSRPFAFAVSLRARPGETVKPGTASTRLHLGPARTTLQPKKTVRLRTCAFRIACRTSVFKAASMALAALDRPGTVAGVQARFASISAGATAKAASINSSFRRREAGQSLPNRHFVPVPKPPLSA